MIGGRIDDFLGGRHPEAEAVLGWPDSFVDVLEPLLESAVTGWGLDGRGLEALRGLGLADPESPAGGPVALTPMGRSIRYQMLEHLWQSGDEEFDACLDLARVGPCSRVLDVGCGAGQTLRLMAGRSPEVLVGIDGDPRSLALGRLLADRSGIPVVLARADAHALPIADETFSMVVCRVALNYMHQASALSELARVVEPGGHLYLRVERIPYDLRLLFLARGHRQALCRARDLGLGLALAATGWQPPTRGGRAFATAGRIRRALRGRGFEVVRSGGSGRCPTLLGVPTQWAILARKEARWTP